MPGKTKAPLMPIPNEGPIDFTKRIRNISVRYLNCQEPTKDNLDQFIVLPLYQKKQDLPCDDDGKTSILLANVDVMRQILIDYDKKMIAEEEMKMRKKKNSKNDDFSKYREAVKEELQIEANDIYVESYLDLEEGEIEDY